MILCGDDIDREVRQGRIIIDPYDPARIEPNSYGFHLGRNLLTYADDILQPDRHPEVQASVIPDEGRVFYPQKLYLMQTMEVMGSDHYASTLYANLSTAAMGVWLQVSAPLGHTGAVICWTLEVRVLHPVRLYRGCGLARLHSGDRREACLLTKAATRGATPCKHHACFRMSGGPMAGSKRHDLDRT